MVGIRLEVVFVFVRNGSQCVGRGMARDLFVKYTQRPKYRASVF